MTEKTDCLPGMPGPPPDSLARQERIRKALSVLHDAMLESLESLPTELDSAIRIRKVIKGDTVTVTFQPGSGE